MQKIKGPETDKPPLWKYENMHYKIFCL